MDKDDVLMESELVSGSDRSALDLSASSRECRTPTPELDTNFIAWRNPVISIDEDSSADAPSPPIPSSDHYESPEQVKDSIQKDLEFIRKYALDAEPDVLYSLLSSEADNPNRLELVMCDMLGLPNAQKLIEEYKKSKTKVGDKRSSDTMVNDSSDFKKRKLSPATLASSATTGECSSIAGESSSGAGASNSSEKAKAQPETSSSVQGESSKKTNGEGSNEFLQTLKDMFPDADGLFLISESQHLKDWDECSRFINTVMLSGLYPKKGGDDSWKQPLSDSDEDVTVITNNSVYRTPVAASPFRDSDEDEPLEIKRKKPSKPNVPVDVVVEISSDSTEPYDVPPVNKNNVQANEVVLEEVINEDTRMSTSLLESNSSDATVDWDKQMADELDFLLGNGNFPDLLPMDAPQVKTTTKTNTLDKSVPAAVNGDVEMGFVTSTSEMNRIDKTERDLLELLGMPGPSNAQSTAKKPKDPIIEAEKIVEQGKKILEVANLLAKKEKNPPVKKISASVNTDRSLLKKSGAQKNLMDIASIVSEAIVPDIDDQKNNKTPEVENPDSSSSSVPLRMKTPPPGPSGLQQQAAPILELDEEMDHVGSSAGNAGPSLKEDPSEEEKKAKWVEDQTASLIRIFPNTDPTFLKSECSNMNCSDEALNEFVLNKLEKNDMPTRAEYEKRMEMEELQNRYTKNFVIEDFLKAIPDPWTYFPDKKRNAVKYKQHSLSYLKSAFRKHYIKDITDALRVNDNNLYLAYQHLKNVGRLRTAKRSDFECSSNRPTTIDIQFLQEVAFIENEERIKTFIENQKLEKQLKFEEAKCTGSLLECQCCYDSEVLVEDTVYCPNDHVFCKDCVVKSVEVEMGNGRCQVNCLAGCDSKFTLASLQSVLKPELFSKVIQANQMEEIKAAGIEDLVQCPFCNYATIMPPEEKVMTCLNPECLKESCRLCKELNHIPLRCEEVEKSEDIKLRTYIENKMTEALVRTCYKCNKKFVKEDGCNKMTCTCGAKMCYVCRKPVIDYTHFNGQGGTDFSKCPLYSTNDELHVDVVKRVAEEAKAEVLKTNPEKKLVHDPTMILPERRNDAPMPGMVRHAVNINYDRMPGHHRNMMANVVHQVFNQAINIPPAPFNIQMPGPPPAHVQQPFPDAQAVRVLANHHRRHLEARRRHRHDLHYHAPHHRHNHH